MPAGWDTRDRHHEWGVPRYYRPRDPSAAVMHVEWQGHWQNYSLDGQLVAEGQGEFPKDILAGFEELSEAQAERLMVEGSAGPGSGSPANNQAQVELYEEARGPQGIGGWLVLPMIGLVLTLAFSLVWMFTDGVSALQPDVWPRIPISGRALVTFEIFANLVGIVAPVALFALIVMKRRSLPKLMIGFYVFVLLAVIADSVGILVIGPDLIPDPALRAEAGWSVATVATDISRMVLVCAIWIPYFLTSRRVKNTFVKPQVAEQHVAATSPSQAAAATKARTRHVWLTGASVVLALGVIGVLVWNCASPGDTPPPASTSGIETYRDTEYGYSFEYPSAWVSSQESAYPNDTSDSVANVYDPFGAGDGTYSFTFAEISLYVMTQPADATMFADLRSTFEETMASNEQNIPSFVLVEPVEQTTFGGIEALRTTYTVEIDGIETTATEYLAPIGTALYSVIFQAASEEWGANQSIFESIAESFKPGT